MKVKLRRRLERMAMALSDSSDSAFSRADEMKIALLTLHMNTLVHKVAELAGNTFYFNSVAHHCAVVRH